MHPDFDDTLNPKGIELGGIEEAPRPVEADLDDTVVPVSTRRGNKHVLRESASHDGSAQSARPLRSYGFRLGASQLIPIDTTIYVGRRPSSPRIRWGSKPPKLLRVPSPRNEVSSTHIELQQLGTSIVVTDMRSTNGTVVSIPGASSRTLRQGESVVVTPGTLIDIGDGNVLEILPLR